MNVEAYSMRIRCPECHFERDIDTTKIPATATVATCPKCGNRFRFRDPQTGRPVLEDEGGGALETTNDVQSTGGAPVADPGSQSSPRLPTEQNGDDPLPPGAIIPDLNDESPDAPASDANTEKAHTGDVPDVKNHALFTHPHKNTHTPPKKWWPFARRDTADTEGASAGETGISYDGVPWEQPERYGFFGSLYHTILRVLFRAPEFFTHIHGEANLTKPVIFYVLLSFFDTFISRLWSMNSLDVLSRTTTDPQALAAVDGLMQGLNSGMLMLMLMTPFLALFRLFFLAGLYHLMIRLAQPDRANFLTVVRVIAYSAAPLVLCVVPLAGSLVGSFWFVSCTFVGCKYALNLTWSRITLALAPLFILEMAVLILVSRMLASVL